MLKRNQTQWFHPVLARRSWPDPNVAVVASRQERDKPQIMPLKASSHVRSERQHRELQHDFGTRITVAASAGEAVSISLVRRRLLKRDAGQ
jgi:hypothetical protein